MKTGWTKIIIRFDAVCPWRGRMYLRMGAKGKGRLVRRVRFDGHKSSTGFAKMRLSLVEEAHSRDLLVMGVD
jgi:hypothetical protein